VFLYKNQEKMLTGLVTKWELDGEGKMVLKIAQERLKNGEVIVESTEKKKSRLRRWKMWHYSEQKTEKFFINF